MLGGIRGQNRKATIETLGAATTMSMQLRDVIGPRATDSVLDERSAAVIDNRADNLSFGFPNERILNLHRLADRRAEELAKVFQDERVGCARRTRANDLLRDWQIDAHNA